MEQNNFLGMEVLAPWPLHFPRGRILPETSRHFTLAFLGPIDVEALIIHLNSSMPKLKTPIGFVGMLNEVIFFPHVVAYNVQVYHQEVLLKKYQHELVEWLNTLGFPPKNQERAWLNHVTIARSPFDEKAWKREFVPIPFLTHTLCLYQSVGNLTYEKKWSLDLLAPFEELSHTADIAFRIRGLNFPMLKSHAEMALAFRFPNLIHYFDEYRGVERVEQLIQHLNRAITMADSKEGSPLKSVSLHGEIVEKDGLLEWEMICDV